MYILCYVMFRGKKFIKVYIYKDLNTWVIYRGNICEAIYLIDKDGFFRKGVGVKSFFL